MQDRYEWDHDGTDTDSCFQCRTLSELFALLSESAEETTP